MQAIAKPYYLLISFVTFCTFNASAQVQINQSVSPTIGSRTLFISIDSAFYKPGNSGPNAVWNFTDIIRRDSTYLYYVDARKTPYSEYFKWANIAMTIDHQIFDYFKFDPSGYFAFGSMGIDGIGAQRKYSHLFHEEPMLQFPMSLGDSLLTQNQRISEYIGSFTNYQSMLTAVKADAYGTLILGKDTFYNTLRIHESAIYNDSFSNGQRSVKSKQIQEKYQWYCNGIQAPLLSLDQTIRVFRGDSTVIVSNSMSDSRDQSAFKNPFPVRLAFNQNENVYEISIDSIQEQLLRISIQCIGCQQVTDPKKIKKYSRTEKTKKENEPIVLYREVKNGANVLKLSEEEVSRNYEVGGMIDIILEGKMYYEVLHLLIP